MLDVISLGAIASLLVNSFIFNYVDDDLQEAVISIINTATANGSGLGDGIATLAKNHGFTITSDEIYAHQDFLGQDDDLTDFELELISGGQQERSDS